MMNIHRVYEALLYQELFTPEELELITTVNGLSMETLNDCIYARYGFRNIKDLLEDLDL